VQASLNQKQRLQQLFFPDGIAFDGKRFVRTAVTAHAFNYLTCADDVENQVASPARSSDLYGVQKLASPRGARVTFDPKHEEAYELALSGTVRRAA
jgi:hypothetical protein